MSTVSSTTSATGTLSLDGLDTGINWQTIVSELTQVSEEELVPYNNEISAYNSQISAWGTISGELGTLQSASTALSSPTALDQYTASVSSNSSVGASSLLSATTSSSANVGTYNVVINSLAQAEQVASSDFSSETNALSISGTFLVNGQQVTVNSSDSLQTLQNSINALNTGSNPTGVTASIVQDSAESYRMVLSSDSTGATGMSLLDGDSNNVLESLGFNQSGFTSATNTTNGTTPITASTLISGISGYNWASGDSITIAGTNTNGKNVSSNFSVGQDTTVQDLLTAIDNTFGSNVAATVTSSGQIQVAPGSSDLSSLSLTTSNSTLSFGSLASNVTGSVANTTNGATPITGSTLLTGISGYNQWTSGDSIAISGTTSSGTNVSSSFSIGQNSTVSDLLNAIDQAFTGDNVTASVNNNGQIQVVDNTTGTSQPSLSLTPSVQDGNSTLSFGSFSTGTVGDVLQQGTNAAFTVDGMNITSSSNTDSSAISGVTLNLLGASPSTTLTLNVAPDTSGIESTVNNMISAYNDVISAIGEQNAYNSTTNTTGGPLFGDPVLESLKSQLENTVLSMTGSGTYNSLASIGITIGSGGTLSMNQSTFEQALSSDFQAVSDVFQDSGASDNNLFQYASNTSSTQSGSYDINLLSATSGTIDGQAATVNGNVWSLSGSTSGANGLSVSYSGSTYPASASFTVNRGVASLFNDLVNSYTDPVTGIITAEDSGMNNSISQLNQQVTETQNNINSQMSTLTSQYEDMNTTVAQLDEQASYLSVQLAAL